MDIRKPIFLMSAVTYQLPNMAPNLLQGFISHLAKAFIDRTIPHYHPYVEIVDGEFHHAAIL